MKKKIKLYNKTKEKLKWLEENKDKYEYEEDFKEAMLNKFNLSYRQGSRVLDIFFGGRENCGGVTNKLSSKEKVFVGINGECYFCGDKKKLVSHHISYIPEKTISLCKSCHSKIHNILKENHQDNIKVGEKFLLLRKKAKEINNLLGIRPVTKDFTNKDISRLAWGGK